MRVSLPIDPHNKTQSKVAIICFVRQRTQIPGPDVIALGDSNDNKLGFEWALTGLMAARSRWQQRRKISMEAKLDLVKHIEQYKTQLFCIMSRFAGIGNISLPREKGLDGYPMNNSGFEQGFLWIASYR